MFQIVCYHVGIAPIMSAQTFPPDWRSWEGLGLNRGVFSRSAGDRMTNHRRCHDAQHPQP